MKNGEDFRKTFNDFWAFVDEYVEKGKDVELKMKVLRKIYQYQMMQLLLY